MKEIKNVEVLITTMNLRDPYSLLSKMNIQNNALIGNQTDYDKVEKILYNHNPIKIYSFNEKGVGLNRNNLLMRSNADYCLFGDDDLEYVAGYDELVVKEFKRHPDADLLIFNLSEKDGHRYTISKEFKVNYLNFMRFGAARIAINRKKIALNGVLFNTCFGGGTPHNNGEDTLFLSDCLKKKLTIYAVPKTIARLTDERESTWFCGYNDKYFKDKGILYYIMSKKYYKFLCIQDLLRHKKLYNYTSFATTYRSMLNAVLEIKQGD